MEGWGLRKHKVLLLVLFSMVLALVLTAFAHAQGYPVELAGVTVLRVRFPASGYDAEERMMIAYERLIDALGYYGRDSSPELVNIQLVSNSPAIYVGEKLFFTVDEDHAAYNGTTPMALAERWADNLRLAIQKYAEGFAQ
jgi:hypothetical protein